MYGYNPFSPSSRAQSFCSWGNILSLTTLDATADPCCRVMAPMMARTAPFSTVSTPEDSSLWGYESSS